MTATLLEKIKRENELRFFFQNESVYYIHYYPNILEFQNEIAEIRTKMESGSLDDLEKLQKNLSQRYLMDYIDHYPALLSYKFLHEVKLTLREHLQFNKELIPLYLEKEELRPEKKSDLRRFNTQKTRKKRRKQEETKNIRWAYALCLKKIERKEKRFPNLRES